MYATGEGFWDYVYAQSSAAMGVCVRMENAMKAGRLRTFN